MPLSYYSDPLAEDGVNAPLREGWSRCPYDAAHRVPTERLGFHLTTCRRSMKDNDPKKFKKVMAALKTCDFNQTHIVPREELAEHNRTCPDRQDFGLDNLKLDPQPQAAAPPPTAPEANAWEEDWEREAAAADGEGGLRGATVYDGGVGLMRSADKPFIFQAKNMSKSQRTALQNENRVRAGGLGVASNPIPGMNFADGQQQQGKKKKKKSKANKSKENGAQL